MEHTKRMVLYAKVTRYILIIFIICTILYNVNTSKVIPAASTKSQGKVIYLTFDDGPSYNVTNDILDILKRNGVKATFFVLGSKIQGREEILKRIVREGCSIGLHSYTHNYSKIYSSQQYFIDEMNKTRDEVKKATGVACNILRFPSGSKPHLNADFLRKLHAENYKIFDWNASLSDGLNCNVSPEKFVRESTRVYGNKSKIILLMHCGEPNKNTCKALQQIIELYKKKGYVFKTITNSTPEFYFKFNGI